MAEPATVFWTPGDTPPLWDPFAALSIAGVCQKLKVHLWPGQPITRESMLVIFFHESGYSNIKQGKGSGPAVGFGQMEIFNTDKIPFFEWLGYDSVTHNPKVSQLEKTKKYARLKSLPPLTHDMVLADNDFAIKMHCKYFEWLFKEGYSKSSPPGTKGIKNVRGMLNAQTGGGGNEHFVDEFFDGGQNLEKVIGSGDRKKIIDALNAVRWYFMDPAKIPAGVKTKTSKTGRTLVHNPISLTRFPKYWDFTLPASDVPGLAQK